MLKFNFHFLHLTRFFKLKIEFIGKLFISIYSVFL